MVGQSWARQVIHSSGFPSVGPTPLYSSATLDPGLGASGFIRGWGASRVDDFPIPSLTLVVPSSSVVLIMCTLSDRWASGARDLFPDNHLYSTLYIW
jgi:hypothetical protein